MIGLFKPKKKEVENIEAGVTDHTAAFEQHMATQGINYGQINQNYPLQYEKDLYPEPTLRDSPPYLQQAPYEGMKGPSETHRNYSQQYAPQERQSDYSYDWESYIQSVVEDILKDKLSSINNQFSEIKIWKEKYEIEISKINEKLRDIENRINNMYEILAKKIEEYDKGIREATVEVEALHRLIRTMVPAISESTKELKETIEEIKHLRDQLKRV